MAISCESTGHVEIEKTDLSVIPNVAGNIAQICFGLVKSNQVSLELYNTVGQKVKSVLNDAMPIGDHKINLSLTDLPAGAYFVKLDAGDYTETKKLLVVR